MKKPSTILFVEDNPSDVSLFNYALAQINEEINLIHYEHGRALLDNIDKHYPATVDCILVDLNMPFVSGWEVIEHLRQMDDFKHIPIIVFTSSNTNEDRKKAYEMGANAYVTKPNELEDLCTAVSNIMAFWTKTNVRVG